MIYFWCYADMKEEYELDRVIEAISPREAAIKATYMAMKEIGEQWEYEFPLRIRDDTGRLSV